MSDLQTRLQEALGDAYQIEREFGGGGMSHVFVARETRARPPRRREVLPPEMSASVNIERFRREIQLAASLQHPHIVPVHRGGAGRRSALLYDAARGGRVAAREARARGRTARSAMRFAFSSMWWRRSRTRTRTASCTATSSRTTSDLGEPRGGHGLRRREGDERGHRRGSLTSLGVALGTPAYMSPEQAAADPHVDHRADLYAVGAMAYEMLCGRPPFSGMSPQQVLAAHVTTSAGAAHRSAPVGAAGAQRARDALPREDAGGSRAARDGVCWQRWRRWRRQPAA